MGNNTKCTPSFLTARTMVALCWNCCPLSSVGFVASSSQALLLFELLSVVSLGRECLLELLGFGGTDNFI